MANDIKKMTKTLVIDKLKNKSEGWIGTSGSIIIDLGLETDNNEFDHFVFHAVSNIYRNNLLKPFGKKMVKLGYKKEYSRGKNRPSNLFRIESCVDG